MSASVPVSSSDTPSHHKTGKYGMLCVPGFIGRRREVGTIYRYDQYLAHGSFGSAWRIIRNADEQVFVAKVTQINFTNGEEALRTAVELICLESLDHFACIRVYDKYRTPHHIIMVMEHCNAGDLSYQLKQLALSRGVAGSSQSLVNTSLRSGMDEHMIKYILLQLTLGLHYMHVHRKMLHRDLKPANVLLTSNGLVKIGDFNLSNAYDTITGDIARTFCGTPAYCAPELWQKKHYGRAADMWSLGVLLYECMTGHVPFCGTQLETLQQSILLEEAPPINVSYPEELKAIVRALLRKDPTDRPDSTALLACPYLREAMGSFAEVLQASGIADNLLHQVQSDIHRQLQPLHQALDPTVYYQGDVELFHSPKCFERFYLILGQGQLEFQKLRPTGVLDSREDEVTERGHTAQMVASSTSCGTGSTSCHLSEDTCIPLSMIEQVQRFAPGHFSIRKSDGGLLYIRTPQSNQWDDVLRRALGRASTPLC